MIRVEPARTPPLDVSSAGPRPVRVLVVDDSPTLRRFALRTLEATGRVQVCGLADSGRGVARAIARHAPDVVLMDIHMPDVDGLQATREVMATCPRPVVLFCSVSEPAAQRLAFQALEAGAVSLVPKPGPGQDLDSCQGELVRAVEVAAGVRTITRHDRSAGGAARVPVDPRPQAGPPAPSPAGPPPAPAPEVRPGRTAVIAVGASTGGPIAVRDLLLGLEAHPAPVVVVQHIVPGFLENLVAWLSTQVRRPVRVARPGQPLERGAALFAPTCGHLSLRGGQLAVEAGPPVNGHRPSVDVLFESVAAELGGAAVGVLLTGMGHDGARGLLELRRRGAQTIGQDEASSTVWGMPRAAWELGAVERLLPPGLMGAAISARA